MSSSGGDAVYDSNTAARRKAGLAAALLLLAGAAIGISVDRLVIVPHHALAAEASPLTIQDMARELDLGSADQVKMRALLDSIETEIAAASAHGLDSLQSTAARAHDRIEAALPPESRTHFRTWLSEHHAELSARMHEMHGGTRPLHRR
jgi:hypothetical protein